MKKLVSVLLSVLVVCAVLPVSAVNAFAAGDYPQLSLNVPYTVEIETENETQTLAFVPEIDGIYEFYSISDEDTEAFLYNEDMDQLAYNDDDGYNWNFSLKYFLSAGVTYYLNAGFRSMYDTGSFDVVCELTDLMPAEGIRFIQGESITGYLGTFTHLQVEAVPQNGYISDVDFSSSDESIAELTDTTGSVLADFLDTGEVTITATDSNGHKAFCTVTVTYPEDIELDTEYTGELNHPGEDVWYRFIPENDGEFAFFADAEDYLSGYLYNGDMSMADNTTSYSGSGVDLHCEAEAGEILYVRLIAGSASTGAYTLIPTQGFSLQMMELVCLPDKIEYYEGVTEGALDLSGMVLKLSWSDGEVTYWSPDNENTDALRGEYIYVRLDDDYVLHLCCSGCEVAFELDIITNPIQSIEMVGDPSLTYYEEFEGYWTTRWNPQTHSYDNRYYYYSLKDRNDLNVLIRYNDGTTKTARIYEKVDDAYINVYDDQDETPWVVGGSYFFRVSYMGKDSYIPVTILPNPVEKLTLTENSSLNLVENADGYLTNNGETFIYFLNNISSKEVQIHYTDGRVVTANISDRVNGYYVEYSSDQYGHPWTRDGDNYVEVSYMGRTVYLPVIIGDTPIESLEFTSVPSRVYIYGDLGYGGTDDFTPNDFTGMAFTIYFKDGHTESYTDADLHYGNINGHEYLLQTAADKQTIGENTVLFSYYGYTASYNVTVIKNTAMKVEVTKLPYRTTYDQYFLPDWLGAVVTVTHTDTSTESITLTRDNTWYGPTNEGPWGTYFELDGATALIRRSGDGFVMRYISFEQEITGMQFEESPTLTGIAVEDFSYTGEDMTVSLYYEGGASETFCFTDVQKINYPVPGVNCGMALTDKGMLPFYIVSAYDLPNGVYIYECFAPAESNIILGDIDGDGEITINDATVLQRWLAEYEIENTGRLLACGDVDGDGKINVRDLTSIQRILAGIE